jgi:EF-hand domain pair
MMDGQQQIPRFEKVMRRMDGDGDGKLSPQEFKVALKRLHFKDERKWTLKMIKRLFDDIDSDKDGLLSVTEFSAMIQDLETPTHTEIVVARHDHVSDDDDEDDAVFTRQRVGSDTDLLKKVLSYSLKNILQDFSQFNDYDCMIAFIWIFVFILIKHFRDVV